MPKYLITSGLQAVPTAAEDKTFQALLPIYSAINSLAQHLSKLTGQAEYSQSELSQESQIVEVQAQNLLRLRVKALEDLLFGHIITLTLSGGKLCASKADATDDTKPAHGCVATVQGISTGQFGEVTVLGGYTAGITGTAVGQYYWLGTAGLVQPAQPAVSGNLVQGIGYGLGSAGFILQISSQLSVVP